MSVPTYDKFIEPVLRFLATRPEGATAREAHEAAADRLNLDESQRAEVIASGQLTYKNRAGWAHDRLKRTGLSQSLSRGKWCLTPEGLGWVHAHPQPLTREDVTHLAFDFNSVKLKQQPDAVDLDPQPEPLSVEELALSSPDDRLEQALNELRSAVADELLENLKQVSPARFEVIVLDVLHRLGYGGHRDDLQRVGAQAMAALMALSRWISWAWKRFMCRRNAGRTRWAALSCRLFMAHWPDKKPDAACLSPHLALLLRRGTLPGQWKVWCWWMGSGW